MTWAATQAKARFSEVLDKAETEGPQLVRRRKHEFVVISREEYDALPKTMKRAKGRRAERLAKQQNLVEFFRNSPLAGIELKRINLKPRHIEF